jgi:protein-S-isoprenylcysteine O-methyltransferase Ste14
MASWQPMGGVVWACDDAILTRLIYAAYFSGWGLMLCASFLINHFELFGLAQAWTACQGGRCVAPKLRTRGIYRHIRHPIYLGWLLVVWASPVMTASHLVFATGMTVYVLIVIQFEERDLVIELPDYRQYKRKVPMLIPSWRKRLSQEPD